MITAQVTPGYVILKGMAYPIEITNLDVEFEVTVTLSGNNTLFTHDSIIIMPATTVVVYAATSTSPDTISVSDGTNTVALEVNVQAVSDEIEYGTESYITIFDLPPDQAPVPPNKFGTHIGLYEYSLASPAQSLLMQAFSIGVYSYSDPSFIQELLVDNALPVQENIHLLMRHGKYFEEPGVLKIWLPEQD